MNMNLVVIGGNLTRTPELRYAPSGLAIVSAAIAINRKWKTETGEAKEEVTFVDFTAFGKTAENIAKFFAKGAAILLQGRLRLEQWDDKQTGAKRQKLSVVADGFQFCGGKADSVAAAAADDPGPPSAAPPPQRTAPAAKGAAAATSPSAPEEDDSIPF